MAASFSYGRRGGRLVHIGDLDPREHRGLQCNCICPECGHQLQAHMGNLKAWHFQHHVEDANCNPQPMTLLHAFVRDELARRGSLTVPGVQAAVTLDVAGDTVRDVLDVAAVTLRFTSAQTEARAGTIQPNITFEVENAGKFALEVRYAHAVDLQKAAALRGNFQWAVEFDVSDLPSQGISAAELEPLLLEPRRWKWLVNWQMRLAESRAAAGHLWRRTAWRPTGTFSAVPDVHHAPTKLKEAQKRLAWAKQALEDLKRWVVHLEDAADWVGEQDRYARVAVACAALRLAPTALPGFLTQTLEKSAPRYVFGASPHRWQPLVFMKFCIGRHPFSSTDAAKWCWRAVPDLCTLDDRTLSSNGFSRTAAALQVYFLQLEAQGLLQGTAHVPREERTFTPRFANVKQLHEYLAASGRPPSPPAALETRLQKLQALAAARNDGAGL